MYCFVAFYIDGLEGLVRDMLD